MGLGVVVDTLVVRTIIVPSLFGLPGDKISWPRAAANQQVGVTRHDEELALAG